MYNAYFGLKEKPFKLVPNPDYLYLSKHHEIALAHLTYAISQGDGFVVITGEVGTGKTTLCRNFLERLDEHTASAYIFHPKLEPVELLTAICNEFSIGTTPSGAGLKQLLDEINSYLIHQNELGRKAVLLIDEAQNLSFENLEMIRMLSNLETTRSKLLQIILVGQPELSDTLDSYELRQLAQRISLTAYLSPLGREETARYIHHRVHIAAQRPLTLFTPAACRMIYNYAKGIPRMINIVSDRCLLTAFSLERGKVTKAIAKLAIQELASRGRQLKRFSLKKLSFAILGLLAVLMLVLLFTNRQRLSAWLKPSVSTADREQVATVVPDPAAEPPAHSASTYKINGPPPADTAGTTVALSEAESQPAGMPTEKNSPESESDLVNALSMMDHQNSRFAAVGQLLAMWKQSPPNRAQLPSQIDDARYFDIVAHQYGLRMHPISSDWSLVRKLDLPAIVALKQGASGPLVYAAMVKWDEAGVVLKMDGPMPSIVSDFESLEPFLEGGAYVFWRNIIGFDALITEGAPKKAAEVIKTLLRRAGYHEIDSVPAFDRQTRMAILDFQKRHLLEPDGLIGPLTKILLIKAAGATDFPVLGAAKESGGP